MLFCLLCLLLLAAACGKKMTPYAPDRVLPAPVREFRLTQEGDSLVASWLLPRENLLGQPLTQVQGCRLYRAATKGVTPEALGSGDFVLYADIDLAYPQRGEVRGEAMLFKDRELAPDQRYYYRVAAYDQDGYLGGWSKTLSHAWGWLPRAPKELKAVPGDKMVSLSWTPVTALQDGSPARDLAGYVIYRLSGTGAWIRVTPAPAQANNFQDVAVLNDVTYTYKIQAVRRLGEDVLASLDSPTQVAMPEKRTPPPPVQNVLVVATSQGVEIRWEESPAPDVAGYRVYRRSTGEEKYTRLTPDLAKKPYFVDGQVTRGQTYHYYVTAVDDSPRANESLPAETMSITY
ncbi:MAG: fibronectin type III domain-containing protein [Deltaproteobacteria bacterium]|nr:fibronectin type III domain-containing protein [Deltaproteobacteria bacterium]